MKTPELDTVAASMRYATHRQDHTEIGGGIFTPDDLRQALRELDSLHELANRMHQRAAQLEQALRYLHQQAGLSNDPLGERNRAIEHAAHVLNDPTAPIL